MAEQELITISEAAEILGISIDTLRRWDKGGKLSPVKTSDAGYRLYSRSQLELFLHDPFGALASAPHRPQSQLPFTAQDRSTAGSLCGNCLPRERA